jgi:glycosyltransferase involved in cell wall biosynthesis
MPRSRTSAHRRLRLAVVCGQLEIGGQEAGMLELLRRLDRRRFVPFVYTFRGGPLLHRIRRLRIRVVVGHGRGGALQAWTTADSRAKVVFRRRLAEAFRADRIDVCLVYAWGDALAAARAAGVPAVVERVDGPKLIGWVRDKSSCQRIICESDSIQRLIRAQAEWLKCDGVPIDVIRNGIDLERFDRNRYGRSRSRTALGLRSGDFVVGTVARLAPVKNLGHLLEAARLLIDQVGIRPRVRVIIAGPDAGAGKALRKMSRDLGIASHVHFLGSRADVPRILRALDVFVLTSIQEGMPFALLEAMAMGVPIVASQADSIAESIRDNAFLVGPLDPYRTTLALRALLSSDGLRRAMGRRGRRLAKRHDVQDMVRQYEQVLRRAFLKGNRQPAFRRRIVVMPGHARQQTTRGHRAIDRLFDALLADGIDVYALLVGAAEGARSPTWPPSRRQWFPPRSDGRLARTTSLEWIQPDVVVTDCPRIVALARQSLPGEEILFLSGPDDACPQRRRAIGIADRVLVESADELRSHVRRWPRWASKMSRLPAGDAGRVARLRALLSQPAPANARSSSR